MIESRYWKEELKRIATTLRRTSRPCRWSERAHCTVERDLMLGFFMVRRLIELHKVSSATSNCTLKVFSCRARGKKVHQLNHVQLDVVYDLGNEVPEEKRPLYLANQFVHAYTSFVIRDESRNWSDVLVVSDFDRNDCIWRVPVSEVRRLFVIAADHYPRSLRMKYNEKSADYDVTTN